MMTTEQWMEVVTWVADRFPTKPWLPEQAVAYYHDLSDFDATDVWSGLYRWYEAGQKFPPNGSQLLAAAREERRIAARDEMYRQQDRALPTVPEKPAPLLSEYSVRRFDEVLCGTALIERIHAEKAPCKTKTCSICYTAIEEERT